MRATTEQKNGLPVYQAEPDDLARLVGGAAPAEVPRLSDDDRRHHGWVVRQLASLPEIEQQIQQLSVQRAQIAAVHTAWLAYVTEVYELSDAHQIDEAGQISLRDIQRHTVPAPMPPPDEPPPHPAETVQEEPQGAEPAQAAAPKEGKGSR